MVATTAAALTGPVSTPRTDDPGRESTRAFFDSLRRIGVTRADERWVGGVAGGVAARLRVDPLLIRAGLVALTLLGGLGVLAYGLAWALLPESSDGRIHLQEAIRGRFDAALAGAGVLVVIGVVRPGFWWWDIDLWSGPFVVLGLIGVAGLVLVLALGRRPSTGDANGPVPPPPGPSPTPPPSPDGWSSTAPAEGTATTTTLVPTPGPIPTRVPVPAAATTTARTTTAVLPAALPAQDSAATERLATGSGGPEPVGPEPVTAAAPPVEDGTRALPPLPTPPAPAPTDRGATTAWTTGAGSASATASLPSPPPPPSQTWTPPPAPTPPRATRPTVRGPGAATTRVALALTLLAVGVVLGAAVLTDVVLQPLAAVVGAVLVALGGGIVVAGLRGRRGGALSALAVLVGLVGLPSAAVQSTTGGAVSWGDLNSYGSYRFIPTTAAEASRGDTLAAGDLTVDLRQLGTVPTTPVPVSLGAGTLTVLVPGDVAAEVRVEGVTAAVGAGTTGWRLAEGRVADGGQPDAVAWSGVDPVVYRTAATGTGPDLVVDVGAGFGNVVLIQEGTGE